MSRARTVLVADDHALVRFGVRRAIAAANFVVCAEADDAQGAIDLARRMRPDVCLLDINMPGNGIVAAATIARELPESAIVMLTVSRADADLFDAFRAGACGYLLKDIDPSDLPAMLEGALEGTQIPPDFVTRLVKEFRRRSRRRRRIPLARGQGLKLNEREEQVVELLLENLTTAAIAERLGDAEATVCSHVSSILRALQVHN